MAIKTDKIGKPEAFYTGGGIWISAMYLDENIYCAIDNDWYEDSFAYYDHRGEDDSCDYPCQNMIGFKNKSEFSDEEHKIYKKLVAELKKEMN